MNINDNKLKQLMHKTERTIKMKIKRRKAVLAGALGTAAIALAVVAYAVFGSDEVPDVTINNPTGQSAAENEATYTPLPDGSTQEPGPTAEPNLGKVWDEWSETQTVEGIEITVYTDIDSMELYPLDKQAAIYNMKPSDFSLETAQKAVEYFLGDEYYEYGMTKADYAIELRAAQAAYDRLDLNETEKAQAQRYMGYVQDWMDSAPESLEKGKIEFIDDNGDQRIVLRAFADDASPSLEITNYGEKSGEPLKSTFSYVRNNYDRDYLEVTPVYYVAFSGEEASKLEAAQILASQAVHEFTDDMELNLAVQGYVYDASLELYTSEDHIDFATAEKCYVFYYTRNYDGILADVDRSPIPYVQDEAVPAPSPGNLPRNWNDEYIRIVVDDLGIAKFEWLNKTETVSEAVPAASILSSGEAEKIFKEQIFAQDFSLEQGGKTEITVTNVGLNMVRVQEGESYKMVPAYTVKGSQISIKPDGSEVLYGNAADNKTLIMIDALDGSIIK